MFKRSISVFALAALTVIGVFWFSGEGAAQYYYRRATQYPFVSAIDDPTAYGAYTQGPGFYYYGGYVPPSAPEEQVAYIHVRVSPPHAEISFQGSKTSQIGSSRLFTSPPLTQGEDFTYNIRVSWKENGREVSQDRTIPVRAGDRLSIVFRAPGSTAGTSTLRTGSGSQP
jgi:uncharacterized protein (TIGR03000 family)